MKPKKSLGQHWLHDKTSLEAVCDAGLVHEHDTVLEIGPGLGTLTEVLLQRAGRVVAVEFDSKLAGKLSLENKSPHLQVVNQDILRFDLNSLPKNYKVIANIPYYLTSNLIRVLSESDNPPKVVALLVQKEVAQRIASKPGEMSILSVTTQMYCEPHLDRLVLAEMFTPPPKVDSQIIQLLRRPTPVFGNRNSKKVFSVVKAGFSSKRKTLANSLSAGLLIEKDKVNKILKIIGIDLNIRAQDLSLEQWLSIYDELASFNKA